MSVRTDEELIAQKRNQDVFRIYKGYTLTIIFENIRKDIEDLEVFDDDVWVCGFPKSGTNWTQEMIWCISNNLNFEAAEEQMETRFVYLEQSCMINPSGVTDQQDILLKSVEVVKNMKRPRFIKTHLPWELMPKQITSFEKRPKIIHVVRNPMDTFVSLYYFHKMLGVSKEGIEVEAQEFFQNKDMFSPLVDNVLSYWAQRNQRNVLCLKYEDMKTNLSSVIDTVVEFLGKTLPHGGKDKLINHLSFESMKEKRNIAPNTFIEHFQKTNQNFDKQGSFLRSGKTGGYRSELSEETIDRFRKEFMDRFEEAGLKFSV